MHHPFKVPPHHKQGARSCLGHGHSSSDTAWLLGAIPPLRMDILLYDDRGSDVFTEAEGRKGGHSPQNGMLAVEQDSSVRTRDGGCLQRGMDGQVGARTASSPCSAQTRLMHPAAFTCRKHGTGLQGRRQRCPTTCSENGAAQMTFKLCASHRARGLLTSSTALPFPTQHGRTARSLLQVSQTDWITRGTTKADPPSHFSFRSRAGMPKT